jgi:signal transduction histidine kinase
MNLKFLNEKFNRLLYVEGDNEEALELKRTYFVFSYLNCIPAVIFLTILTYILDVPVLQLYGWMLLSFYFVSVPLFLYLKKHLTVFYYFNALTVMSITFFIVLKQGGLLYSGGILYTSLSTIIFSFVFESIMLAIVTSAYYIAGIGIISFLQPRLIPAPEMLEGNINLIFTTINSLFISVLIFTIIYYVFKKRIRETKIKNEKILESMERLKATQAQLIQSEKMASLGELTASIAHEIQNPLNFVNNFSELSIDLAREIKNEVQKQEIEYGLIVDLADDMSRNQEKINHHGKRASDIVKAMLEHAKTSHTGKEPTDINALCSDYFRLAFNDFTSKNKGFTATIEIHLDPNLPKINIDQQAIGRVILNLVNNACYAVNERFKKGESDYRPSIRISTEKSAINQLVISVNDNGIGIPASIKEKIFQPFFTTKPTGRGIGLGLSLAHDIVKVHEGKIEVESDNKEGTSFTVTLPF